MSQPSLASTPIGTNMSNTKVAYLVSTPDRAKTSDHKQKTLPTEFQKREKQKKLRTRRYGVKSMTIIFIIKGILYF